MTIKLFLCAFVFFILTMLFCLGVVLLTKLCEKNEKYASYVSVFSIAFAFFGIASFLGTVCMTVFFIQSLFGVL